MRRLMFVGLLLVLGGCESSASYLNSQGVNSYYGGDFALAKNYFQEAMLEDPSDPNIYYNLASSYHRIGDRQQADFFYNQCLMRDPGHARGHHALAVSFMEQGRTDEAHRLIETWVAVEPYRPEPHVELAWLQKEGGDRESARLSLQRALEIDPAHPKALTQLASLYEHDRPDRAVVLYERSLQSDRNQPQVANRLAQLRYGQPVGGSDPNAPRVVQQPAAGPTVR